MGFYANSVMYSVRTNMGTRLSSIIEERAALSRGRTAKDESNNALMTKPP